MAEGNFFPGPTAEEIIIALGYTPENVANKATDFSVLNNTKYPTTEATNNQIIASISSVSSYFFYKTASDISTYWRMTNVSPTGGSQSITASSLAVGEHVVAAFATNAGYPNKTFYPSGWTTTHLHAEKSGGGSVTLRIDVYKRTTGGTETLICSSDASLALTGTATAYDFDALNETLDSMLASDRIVTKVVAIVASGTPNVTIYIEDAYLSRTNLPVQQTSYSNYFYSGVYASKPDPSTLADGITAWFTDKPNSNGGSYVVRSTATPGTKIWDRVGGGPVAIDTWSNCNSYNLAAYDGCTFRVTDIGAGGYDFIATGGYLRPKDNSGEAITLFAGITKYINFGGSSASYFQTGTTVTVTQTSHGFTAAEHNGSQIYLVGSTGSLVTGWFTGFTYVNADSFTCTSSVSQSTSGNLGTSTAKVYANWSYQIPSGLIKSKDSVATTSFVRSKNAAGTKTYTCEYSGTQVGSTTQNYTAAWGSLAPAGQFFEVGDDANFITSGLGAISADTTRTYQFSMQNSAGTDWTMILPSTVVWAPRYGL